MDIAAVLMVFSAGMFSSTVLEIVAQTSASSTPTLSAAVYVSNVSVCPGLDRTSIFHFGECDDQDHIIAGITVPGGGLPEPVQCKLEVFGLPCIRTGRVSRGVIVTYHYDPRCFGVTSGYLAFRDIVSNLTGPQVPITVNTTLCSSGPGSGSS